MSRENVETVRAMFDAFPHVQRAMRTGQLPVPGFVAADIGWDASDLALPDLGDGRLRGHDGFRRFWVAWLSAWQDVSIIDYELIEAGDRVVCLIEQAMRSAEGMTLTARYAQVCTFRDGTMVHWKLYRDQDEALEAAGLRA